MRVLGVIRSRITRAHPDHHAIAKGMVWVALFVFLGRLAGAAKEMAVAYRYGVGEEVDAYLFVLSLVSWPVGVWFSVLTVVLVPLAARMRQDATAELPRFRAELFGLALLIGLTLATVAWLGLPSLLRAPWTGLPATTAALASRDGLHACLPDAIGGDYQPLFRLDADCGPPCEYPAGRRSRLGHSAGCSHNSRRRHRTPCLGHLGGFCPSPNQPWHPVAQARRTRSPALYSPVSALVTLLAGFRHHAGGPGANELCRHHRSGLRGSSWHGGYRHARLREPRSCLDTRTRRNRCQPYHTVRLFKDRGTRGRAGASSGKLLGAPHVRAAAC